MARNNSKIIQNTFNFGIKLVYNTVKIPIGNITLRYVPIIVEYTSYCELMCS